MEAIWGKSRFPSKWDELVEATPEKKQRKKRETKPKTDNSWKERYKHTFYDYQLKKHGQKFIDDFGYMTIRNYPNVNTHKGFEEAFENIIKWEGGAFISTPTTGTPRYGEVMVGGKLTKQIIGYMGAKGGRGKQDGDVTLLSVNFKAELKVKTDIQKEQQIKYQKRIEAAGGTYILFRTMQQVYDVIDKIKAGISLKGELF